MRNRQGLTIGQVAERTGLATSAIRYYEEQGLVFPFRNDAGQRRFASADIRRLSFVMVSQSLGFSIAEIRTALAPLPVDRAPTKADWTRISRMFGAEIDSRISRMQTLRAKLDGCIGCGCLSLKSCSLYNFGDKAAKKGPGPRHLLDSD
ncbi:MAG: redox-sensitive transcriptional activator SoxR [Paracoccaceae bacterium]|jgi:MerR family transcriptional regulator, redox-sensitive transcriptional activator SoxR|nr:redox-sensitive transcriptional activator SoxR [Paracoccaceae bacterium]